MDERERKLNMVMQQLKREVVRELGVDPEFTGQITFTFNCSGLYVRGDVQIVKKRKPTES